MITIEQRIELLKGGYTPEQIAQFEQPEQEAQHEQPAQQEQPAQEPPEQKEPDALQLIRNMFESNKEVAKNMAQLTAAIQANALASTGLPGSGNMPTAEEALASIIAPKPKERS